MAIDHRVFWNEAKDYIGITLGLLIYATAFTLFLMPYEIVTGGVTGMSAIIYYATGFKLENTYMIINLALLVVALKILGVKFMVKTIYALFTLYFLLKFAQMLMPVDTAGHYIKILGPNQDFMSLLIGCCFTGTALAVVFMNNGSTGGTDIIAPCVNKYRDVSLGPVPIAVGFLIIGSCFFFPQFGDIISRLHKVVFGLCTMVGENFMLDHVMNIQRQSVQFMIFSKKSKEIAHAIGTQLDRGITILDGHGWYTGQEMKVLCILARKRESTTIFRIIKMIDPDAFVSQSSVIGVYGEGFDHVKIKVNKHHKKTLEQATTSNEQETNNNQQA